MDFWIDAGYRLKLFLESKVKKKKKREWSNLITFNISILNGLYINPEGWYIVVNEIVTNTEALAGDGELLKYVAIIQTMKIKLSLT